jgi:hypothetical protein
VDDAQQAYSVEWKPWRQGTPIVIPKDKDGKDLKQDDGLGAGLNRLMQFNIEAVTCRFSDRLSNFWSKLPEKVKDKDRREVLPPDDLAAPPGTNDRGWVIELRGYTFHKADITFVKDVLMENIVRKAKEKPLNWPLPNEPMLKPDDQQGMNPGGGGMNPGGMIPPGGGAGGENKPAGPARAISHVILYNSTLKKDGVFASTPFEIIGTPKAGTVVIASATTTQPGPGGPGPGGPGPGGPSPVPGGSGAGGGAGAGGGGPGPGPGGSTPPGPGGPGGGFPGGKSAVIPWVPLGIETLDATTNQPVKPGSGTEKGPMTTTPQGVPVHEYWRTEFVIFFIWREPNPADYLLPLKTDKPADGQGGFNQGGFGPGGGSGQQGGFGQQGGSGVTGAPPGGLPTGPR